VQDVGDDCLPVIRSDERADDSDQARKLDPHQPCELLIDRAEAFVQVPAELGHFAAKSGHLAAKGAHLRAKPRHVCADGGEIQSSGHLAPDQADLGAQLDPEIGNVLSQLTDPDLVSLASLFQVGDSLVNVGHGSLSAPDPSARFYIVIVEQPLYL
jgi:hypothetical protein